MAAIPWLLRGTYIGTKRPNPRAAPSGHGRFFSQDACTPSTHDITTSHVLSQHKWRAS